MSDSHRESDQWAELASKLGAVPPEPSEPECPDSPLGEGPSARSFEEADSGRRAAPRPAQVRLEVPQPFRPAREPRPPTDWDLLAEELGIVEPARAERLDPSPASEPAEQPLAPAADTVEPIQGTKPPVAAAGAVFVEDEAEAAAARFEEAVELFDDVAEPEPAASAPAPAAEPSPDRLASDLAVRGSTDAEPASAEAAAAHWAQFQHEAASLVPEELGQMESSAPDVATAAGLEALAKAGGAPAADSIAEAAAGKRGKRRRRRTGRKKKGPASATLQSKSQEEEKAAEPADASEADKAPAKPGPRLAPDQAADAPAPSPGAAKADKAAHRGIPTWEQAVGLIIAKNMESRPKRKR